MGKVRNSLSWKFSQSANSNRPRKISIIAADTFEICTATKGLTYIHRCLKVLLYGTALCTQSYDFPSEY